MRSAGTGITARAGRLPGITISAKWLLWIQAASNAGFPRRIKPKWIEGGENEERRSFWKELQRMYPAEKIGELPEMS